MLTPDDLTAIGAAVERALAPAYEALVSLSARTAATETRLTALAQITEAGFRQVLGRLDSLEARVARLEEKTDRIEERLSRLVADVTRGRTSDSERIAVLEARVAELEERLGIKH